MSELRVLGGRLRVSPEGDAEAGMELAAIVRLLAPDGTSLAVPVERVDERSGELTLTGAADGFEVDARWRAAGAATRYHEAEMTIRHIGSARRTFGLRVEADVLHPGQPSWLIPGLFYGENRVPANRRVYPRWNPAGSAGEDLVSDHWSFRADRSALPVVFCWGDRACVALWGAEWGSLGEHGLGFAGRAGQARIWLDAPYREEPVVYGGPEEARAADVRYHEWQPGERQTLRFAAFAAPPDRHAYDALLREAYAALRADHPLRPWMEPAEAVELAAHGLLRWHYRAEHAALFETAAFDREGLGGRGDRAHMHVAWVSGAPWAAALLAYGRRARRTSEVAAGTAVLDKISSGLAPCGAFWGEWRADGGWSHGWNRGGQLHARTLAEATLFVARALADEQRAGGHHPTWAGAVRSNLEFVVSRQREDGNCGAYYDPRSGEVTEWAGAAGLGWVAALAEGAALLDEPGWLSAAERAGGYYARFVEDELIYGAPEDVHLTPTSEDGYQAVMAYVALHTTTGNSRWLDLARLSAEWMLTFRYPYNVRFDEHTLLAAYDFRTRGADQASPSNQHLHAYGLICLPEMIRLWRATGDDYYLDRTRDNLSCFLQFVAREDGDFNAYRGMVSERYYQTDWAQAKGMLLGLSHAWSVGAVLHASLAALDDTEAFPPGWPFEVDR
ncbi:MAG: hypothetical protein M3N29_07990 [Chloroflexota bacterium]|nr:hypothetical protein [Chloroflexota bacterium]